MAGTIPGFGPMIVHRDDGRAAASATLDVWIAGSSVRANLYSDSALTAAISNPIVADASGLIPQFWLADGSYRCRLKTSTSDGESVLADEDSITAVGAAGAVTSSGSSSATWETGDVIPYFKNSTRTGWVRCNGRTIGSASSSATERASLDCEELFAFLWDNFSDTACPVSGGRGASAAADWAANKTIALPDLRGRSIIGLDDMGNTAAGRITAATVTTGTATTLGGVGGTETHTLTEAQLPIVTPAGSVATSIGGNVGGNSFPVSVTQPGYAAGGGTAYMGSSQLTATISATSTFTGSSFGSGNAHNNMPPFYLALWLMRL